MYVMQISSKVVEVSRTVENRINTVVSYGRSDKCHTERGTKFSSCSAAVTAAQLEKKVEQVMQSSA